MEDFKELHRAIYAGDGAAAAKAAQAAFDSGLSLRVILDDGLIAPMAVVGEKFKRNDVFIPEVILSARAMQAGLKVLEPHFAGSGIKPIGSVVIGTVKGDLHDIGKNIVSMMLKGAGFLVEDLGIDVPIQRFVDRVKKGGIDILAMSSLLTTSMGSMESTLKSLEGAGVRSHVKVMVGGAPVTNVYAEKIGADGYARDAATAVDVARGLVRKI